MHMRDPVAILEKRSAWTKPGGVVVAQEFDFGAIAVEPTCQAMGEFNRVFEGVFRGHGRNMRAGVSCRRNSRRQGSGFRTELMPRYISCHSRKWRTC